MRLKQHLFLITLLIGGMMVFGLGSDRSRNAFGDPIRQQIATLQNDRNADGLLGYLKHDDPRYRRLAARAFASVQPTDPRFVEPLVGCLTDSDESVRSAAAYALGQIGNNATEMFLIRAFTNEKTAAVKRDLLEALGKCGSNRGLVFVLQAVGEHPDAALLEGQALALYRYALRKLVLPVETERAMAIIRQDGAPRARLIALHYLARGGNMDLSPYAQPLLEAYKTTRDVNIRMALALALGKAKTTAVLTQLKTIALSPTDYRVRVNAVRAMGAFDYPEIKDTLMRLLSDPNAHVAIAASEYFITPGLKPLPPEEAMSYFKIAGHLSHWRVRANMLNAALTLSKDENDKNTISTFIIDTYRKSRNVYEQSWLMTALTGDIRNVRFLESEVFANVGTHPILCTNGIGALTAMCAAPGNATEDQARAFAAIFEKAVGTPDVAVKGTAAAILRDPRLNLKRFIKDSAFLTTALAQCHLPDDWDAWVELKKTIAFFRGETGNTSEVSDSQKVQPIDWKLVKTIPSGQRVTIKTTRGTIVIRLMVEDAPAPVANFIRLIKDGFYRGVYFHRVVSNFVIQAGCPRGDGNGGPPYVIGSDFSLPYYDEGSVGMASGGKDTEGSQWFITHSPTPHLDGKYTIFAKVVSGMDVVHRIHVGDRILGFHIQ